MTCSEIADQLLTLCRSGQFVRAIDTLYAEDVRQHENGVVLSADRSALAKSCQAWLDSRTVHAADVCGVHVGPDSFVIEFEYDVTPHDTRVRAPWREAAIYRVRGGRIADVRFYYAPPVASA